METPSDHTRDEHFAYPPHPATLSQITLSSWQGIKYKLLKSLGAGGKGLAFTAEQHGGARDGMIVVVKIPNINVKDYTEDQVRDRIDRLRKTYESELEPSKDLRGLPGVAAIEDMGVAWWLIQHRHKFNATLPFAVFEYIPGENLDDWCVRKHGTNGVFTGIKEPEVWFRLTKQLLSIMQTVHHQRVIHGDLWPENIRINDAENITVIDFGECWKIDTARDHDPDFASSRRHSYLAPERLRSEFNQRRKWYTPADIYSIGGVLFYLATGQSPPTPLANGELRKNRDIKEEIIQALSGSDKTPGNPDLYRACPGVADIISICMHPRAEDRVSRISPILDTVDLFSPQSIDHPNPSNTLSLIDKEISALADTVKTLKSRSSAVHPVFQRLVLSRVQQLRDEVAPLASNLFVLEGDRETHINGLVTCLDTLRDDDQILAVTSSQFWKPGNFGPYGRLLTKLITIVDRGVKVSWIVLTHSEPTEIDKEVMTHHKRAVQHFCTLRNPSCIDNLVGKDKPLFIGFCPRSSEEIDQLRRARNAFILLRHSDEWLLVAPDYRIGDYGSKKQSLSVETTITSLRIWADARRTENLQSKHDEYLAMAESVLQWGL